MPVVSGAEFLKAARQGGYAVGGFNTNNLEWTQAILEAAEAKTVIMMQQWNVSKLVTLLLCLMALTYHLKKT